MDNQEILKQRFALFNGRTGPRVGDYLKLPHGGYTRFTHKWENSIQTGGCQSGYYLGNGYLSYSGGLDSGVQLSDIEQSEETREGSIWFFDNNLSGAGRGKTFTVNFRVFILKEGADLKGLPQIAAHAKKLLLEKVEKITRINGNGQRYTLPLPEIHIKSDLINDVWLKYFKDNTGVELIKTHWGYTAQPMTHVQLNNILTYNGWSTTFYNNATFHNTLVLEFNKETIKAL